MLKLTFRILVLVAVVTMGVGSAFAQARLFDSGSLEAIKRAHQGRPFVLMMWSLDCTSCVRELNVLAAQVKEHPEIPLVMVSTDDASLQPKVEAMLAKHGLERLESWVFSGDNMRRLRYEIDPTWYGELPRSYFYDAQHERVPLSGVVTEQHLTAWLSAVGH